MKSVFTLALAAVASAYSCDTPDVLIKTANPVNLCLFRTQLVQKRICYGYKLDGPTAQADIEAVGGDYEAVLAGGCLTAEQCDSLLPYQVAAATVIKEKIYGAEVGC